jgi:hypothetical protein
VKFAPAARAAARVRTQQQDKETQPSPWPSVIAGAKPGLPLRALCRIETPPLAPVRYDTVFFHVPLETARPAPRARTRRLARRARAGPLLAPLQALAAWRTRRPRDRAPIVIVLEHLARSGGFEDFASDASR